MKIELLETAGWYTIFKNLRQSYSLDSRSGIHYEFNESPKQDKEFHFLESRSLIDIQYKDLQLLSTLVRKGDSHSKIIRGLQTYVEITAPRYWWQEWITYTIGVLELNPAIDWVSLSSESTMHTLLKENNADADTYSDMVTEQSKLSFSNVLNTVNDLDYRKSLGITKVKANLPEGYLQTRTYMVSYQAWRRIYEQRANHKLEEWNTDIVKFIEGLPFAKELIIIE